MEDSPSSAESEPALLSRDRMVLVVTAPGIEAEHILHAGREGVGPRGGDSGLACFYPALESAALSVGCGCKSDGRAAAGGQRVRGAIRSGEDARDAGTPLS
jgi:hypothetical protein